MLTALLYGGIAEEVMLRWGVLSAGAVLLARLFRIRDGSGQARNAASRPAIMWGAIVLAAILAQMGAHVGMLAVAFLRW